MTGVQTCALPICIPKNGLDVLAQHIIGMCIEKIWSIEDAYNLIKQSYNYKTLSYEDFMNIIKYLSGRYTELEDRSVYAKIWYDDQEMKIGKKGKSIRMIYSTNVGTIPDQSSAKVYTLKDEYIGSIDESFLESLKKGDRFVLGGKTYEFRFARSLKARVTKAYDKQPTVPSWFSEMLPLSFDLAMDIGKFRKLLGQKFCYKKPKKEILDFIDKYLYVDKNAAESIYRYFFEQFNYAEVPSDTRIVVEHYNDEKFHYTIFHSLYGRRVNDCLSRAVAYAISRTQHRDVEIGISDNGFYIMSEKKANVIGAFKLLKSKELRKVKVRPSVSSCVCTTGA